MQKYRAKKIETPDGVFDSQGEYLRWCELKLLEDKGEIKNLERQVVYTLIPKQKLPEIRVNKKGLRQLNESEVKYKADFVYEEDGQKIVEDFKGMLTPEYKIKRKLMLYLHGIQIRETY